MKCIHGEGPRNQVEELIEKTLEEQGRKYRVKEYGRIKIYKTGLFKKITLIYNYSDSTFQICGDKHILENIRKNKLVYTNKINLYEHTIKTTRTIDIESEKAYNLLIERQKTIEKLRHCKTRNTIILITTTLLPTILYLKTREPATTLTITAIIITTMLIAPTITRIDGEITPINTYSCIKLRKELSEIDKTLLELINRVKNENIKKIIALQLSRKNK